MLSGCLARVSAALLPMTDFPSNGKFGSWRETVPVATRKFSAVCSWVEPSAALTATVRLSLNEPTPRR